MNYSQNCKLNQKVSNLLSLKRFPLNKCLMIDLVFGRKWKKNKAWQRRIAPFGVCRLLISHLVVQTSRPAPRPLLQKRNHTNTLPKVTFTGTCKSGISYSTFPMNLNLKANKCFCLISQLRGVAANISSPQQQKLKVKIKIQEIDKIKLMILITKTYFNSAIKRGKHFEWKQR